MEEVITLLGREPVLWGIGAFIPLALAWYNTGRFFIIGWIVRLLWLVVNIASALLWVVVLFINGFFDILRSAYLLARLIYVGGVGFNVFVYMESPALLIATLPPTLLVMYVLRFGLKHETVKGWITYSPKPKRQPEKKAKREPPRKAAAAPEAPPALKLPEKPLVQIVARQQGQFERIEQIKALLDPMQQKLLAGEVKQLPAPEAPPTPADQPPRLSS